MSLLDKYKEGLSKTKTSFFDKILGLFRRGINEEVFEELEEILISADVGFETTEKIIDILKEEIRIKKIKQSSEAVEELKSILIKTIGDDSKLILDTKPSVILVIGVNGVGKTTTIGKLANNLARQGKKVMLVAADTFRAGAIEQLQEWAERSKSDIIKQKEGSDPSAVVYDAIKSSLTRNVDVIIVDTAGRLHNKSNLMAELSKINRIIDRELPDSDKETLLVLDSTTGQNAVNQAIEFNKTANISGIVLTKLDGTAKGGIIISVHDVTSIPVKLIGIGEGINDLQPFDSKSFVEALLNNE